MSWHRVLCVNTCQVARWHSKGDVSCVESHAWTERAWRVQWHRSRHTVHLFLGNPPQFDLNPQTRKNTIKFLTTPHGIESIRGRLSLVITGIATPVYIFWHFVKINRRLLQLITLTSNLKWFFVLKVGYICRHIPLVI